MDIALILFVCLFIFVKTGYIEEEKVESKE